MSGGWVAWAADALVLTGLGLASLAVLGVRRLPDIYAKLHAAGKMASLGVASFALAAALSAGLETAARAAMATFFVALTAAVTSHAVARAAAACGDRMRGERSFDESPWRLDRSPDRRPG